MGEPRRPAGTRRGLQSLRPPRDARGDGSPRGARGRVVGAGRALAWTRGCRALRRCGLCGAPPRRGSMPRKRSTRRLRLDHQRRMAQSIDVVHREGVGRPLEHREGAKDVRENEPIGSEDRSKKGDSTTRRRRWVLVVVLLVVPSALYAAVPVVAFLPLTTVQKIGISSGLVIAAEVVFWGAALFVGGAVISRYCRDRKSTRLNSSHANISYAVFCLKKKKTPII